MEFEFYPSLTEFTVKGAMDMNGAELKEVLSRYSKANPSYMTIMINNRVLADSQKPGDIDAKEGDTGLCFICVNEPFVVDTKVVSAPYAPMGIVTPISTKTKGSTTSFPYNQNNALTALRGTNTTVTKPLSDNEFAQREIESGKYISALREVKAHPTLENYFMNQLKTVDSKLHAIFTRNHALLRQYIDNSDNIQPTAAAFTLLREEDNEGIMQIMEVGNLDYEEALGAYFNHNRNFESWIQSMYGA